MDKNMNVMIFVYQLWIKQVFIKWLKMPHEWSLFLQKKNLISNWRMFTINVLELKLPKILQLQKKQMILITRNFKKPLLKLISLKEEILKIFLSYH